MTALIRSSTLLECLPFAVDTWSACSTAYGKPHFLTHCHKDHTDGIETCEVDVYCTALTRRLLLLRQPEAAARNRLHVLDPGCRTEVTHGSVTFSVTALDANHCPGSAMFLFQGCFGNVLHTGDCRLTPEIVLAVQACLGNDSACDCDCTCGQRPTGRQSGAGSCRRCCSCGGAWDEETDAAAGESLDLLYLDCTFADLPLEFPSREEAVRQAEQLIRSWPASSGQLGPRQRRSNICGYSVGAGRAGEGYRARSTAADPWVAGSSATPAGPSSRSLRRVYLSADLLGTEALLAMVGDVFRQPLYVCPPERHNEYGFANADLVRQRRQELEILLPHLTLSDDPGSLFHLCGIRNFAHRGRQGQGQQQQPERSSYSASLEGSEKDVTAGFVGGVGCEEDLGGGCLFIRASTQVLGQRIRERFDRQHQMLSVRAATPAPAAAVQERAVHYVLYAAHSSRSELVAALTALRPRATRPIQADQVGCMAAVVSEVAGTERTEDVEAEIAARMAWAAAEPAEAPSPCRSKHCTTGYGGLPYGGAACDTAKQSGRDVDDVSSCSVCSTTSEEEETEEAEDGRRKQAVSLQQRQQLHAWQDERPRADTSKPDSATAFQATQSLGSDAVATQPRGYYCAWRGVPQEANGRQSCLFPHTGGSGLACSGLGAANVPWLLPLKPFAGAAAPALVSCPSATHTMIKGTAAKMMSCRLPHTGSLSGMLGNPQPPPLTPSIATPSIATDHSDPCFATAAFAGSTSVAQAQPPAGGLRASQGTGIAIAARCASWSLETYGSRDTYFGFRLPQTAVLSGMDWLFERDPMPEGSTLTAAPPGAASAPAPAGAVSAGEPPQKAPHIPQPEVFQGGHAQPCRSPLKPTQPRAGGAPAVGGTHLGGCTTGFSGGHSLSPSSSSCCRGLTGSALSPGRTSAKRLMNVNGRCENADSGIEGACGLQLASVTGGVGQGAEEVKGLQTYDPCAPGERQVGEHTEDGLKGASGVGGAMMAAAGDVDIRDTAAAPAAAAAQLLVPNTALCGRKRPKDAGASKRALRPSSFIAALLASSSSDEDGF